MNLTDLIRKALASFSLAAMLTPSSATIAQPKLAHGVRIQPEARALVYSVNALGNGLACGIAAAVKKRNVLKDTLKCLLAGSIQYAGLEAAMYDAPGLPGLALRAVETGTSMVDNTLAGRGLFEHLHYSLGPALIQLDLHRNRTDLYWEVLPLVGIVRNVAKGHEFSFTDSISYQVPVFTRTPTAEDNFGGEAIGNVLMYEHTREGRVTPIQKAERSHEFAHVLQYVRLRPMQRAMPRPLRSLEEKIHLRTGEDLTFMALSAPLRICFAVDGKDCEIQLYNPLELEAYAMQTAAE
jgi:hypothetical protein